MLQPQDFIMMPIPAKSYSAVCALLGGALVVKGEQVAAAPGKPVASVQPDTDVVYAPSENTDAGEQSSISSTATSDASPSDGNAEIDAHGHPWSADLHASTKGKTKDGLWRLKVGATRPAPLPGFPVDNNASGAATDTSPATEANSATSPTATVSESAPAATSGDEDEFAAFRAAAAASEATDAAAAASVPARKFSDADLGALCNQAAVKLGDPSPIKEIIARYVPEGQVAHSRNIPTERREEFAKEVEAKAGIQFAG